MKTITHVSPTHTSGSASCLECTKTVGLVMGFGVEVVRISDHTVEGYLRPKCQAKWENDHTGFEYVKL